MEIFKTFKKIRRSRRVVLTLPETVKVGETIELTNSITPVGENDFINSRKKKLNLAEWSRENALEFNGEINSSDVESFTGRKF